MIKALIRTHNGGRYGRMGERIALVEPEYFKNGNLKKTNFKIIEELEILKKGYNSGNARQVETIKGYYNNDNKLIYI